jgi:hypothetical protein
MLGEMTQNAFDILLAGAKSQYELRIAAEKKAEEDRIAKEKADKLSDERKLSLAVYAKYIPKLPAEKLNKIADDEKKNFQTNSSS